MEEMAYQSSLQGVRVAGRPTDALWNVSCRAGRIQSIEEHKILPGGDYDGRLLAPSLCHPHIHLDKCFLLSHPKYSDLIIQSGDFAEAMKITSNVPANSLGENFHLTEQIELIRTLDRAKARFEHEDLLERGRALIDESVSFGVTHMRAFVEVDSIVKMKCLQAGLELKMDYSGVCYIQICVFAQDPIYSQKDGGKEMRDLMDEAASRKGVDVIGSTPYVEKTLVNQHANIDWMIGLAKTYDLHLDFHIDYNLDTKNEPTVYHVIQALREMDWKNQKAVTLGHCTRLTLFTAYEWHELHDKIGDLPIFFVGLPTSDLFMMGRPHEDAGGGDRIRGTLQIPQMIERYGLQGAIGVNNVGNAFTPQGSCDPLSVASMGVGIYQVRTKIETEILMQCVSTRAKIAMGLSSRPNIEIKEGDAADFVLYGAADTTSTRSFRHRKTVVDLVYDACRERTTIFGGAIVSRLG